MRDKLTQNEDDTITIPVKDIYLEGILHVPDKAKGVVLFVHGSGSSRLSPRNQATAKTLQQAQFATLLFDLLTMNEEQVDIETRTYRFDMPLLSERLLAVTNWVLKHPQLKKQPIAYFGSSTGGGAALLSAGQEPALIKAVVSRGGRPDLAGRALKKVSAATLLIVGGNDESVIALNQKAFSHLTCKKELAIVEGASHLFEEPGKLEEVASLAASWFEKYLSKSK